MRTKRLFLALHIAALTAAAACGDTHPSAPAAITTPATQPTTVTIRGTVESNNSELGVYLNDGDNTYALSGNQFSLLSTVVGAQIVVTGNLDGRGGLDVQRFEVLLVDGRKVNDGILVQTEDGYILQSISGAHEHQLVNLPESLKQLVNKRVWIAGLDEDQISAFGLIGDM